VAERLGFGDFEAYNRDRRARGWTINEIAKEAGRDRQWLRVARDRYESTSVHHHRLHAERRHTLTAIGLGFLDLDSYLRQRHVQEGRGTTELAHELGVDARQNTVVAVALGTAVRRWPTHGTQVSNGNRRLCTSRLAR
jgi:hypothetical protein